MYLLETIDPTTWRDRNAADYFTAEELARANRLEIWASSFNDPGPDFCEYRLLRAGAIPDADYATRNYPGAAGEYVTLVAHRRREGY